MEYEFDVCNCWVLELYYDREEEFYFIYWVIIIFGCFFEMDLIGDNGYNYWMYYIMIKDFNFFSEIKLLYDYGFNVIDVMIYKFLDEYIMFLKNEI